MRSLKPRLHLLVGTILLGSILTGTIFFTKIQVDKYSLPGFIQMDSSTDVFMKTVRVLDIAGASICVGHNLFSDLAPNLSLDEIKNSYDPRHINLSRDLLNKVPIDYRVNEVWLNVALHHPICFFNNKFELIKYMTGFNSGTQFLITAPSIDSNEFGYKLSKSWFRDEAVSYITHASQVTFFKPWFLYLISIIAFIYMISVRALTTSYLTMFLSAIFYFGGLFLFGNAADARLLFYTTTVILILIFISIIELKRRFQ